MFHDMTGMPTAAKSHDCILKYLYTTFGSRTITVVSRLIIYLNSMMISKDFGFSPMRSDSIRAMVCSHQVGRVCFFPGTPDGVSPILRPQQRFNPCIDKLL